MVALVVATGVYLAARALWFICSSSDGSTALSRGVTHHALGRFFDHWPTSASCSVFWRRWRQSGVGWLPVILIAFREVS